MYTSNFEVGITDSRFLLSMSGCDYQSTYMYFNAYVKMHWNCHNIETLLFLNIFLQVIFDIDIGKESKKKLQNKYQKQT